MTIRHMIIFRTVCENGYNSTKAAEILHMTQPAVSLAIKELEQYYGVHLFDRIGRRLQITDAGQHFLQYAIHISDLFSDMETGLRDWDSKGVLRIGASITIGSQFLPNYVKAFSELCPGLDVRVTVEQSERLEQKILANELDCALIEGIAHDPNIVSEAYMEDHLSVICGTDKGWTQGQVISIEDFQRQRFLLREKGSGTREVFNRVVEQAGIHITPVWEAMSTTALVNAAINGLGIAVLPHRMILPALRQGLICTVKVEGLSFSRNFHIIHHKDKFLTTSAKRFITLCRDFETDYPLPCYNVLYELKIRAAVQSHDCGSCNISIKIYIQLQFSDMLRDCRSVSAQRMLPGHCKSDNQALIADTYCRQPHSQRRWYQWQSCCHLQISVPHKRHPC